MKCLMEQLNFLPNCGSALLCDATCHICTACRLFSFVLENEVSQFWGKTQDSLMLSTMKSEKNVCNMHTLASHWTPAKNLSPAAGICSLHVTSHTYSKNLEGPNSLWLLRFLAFVPFPVSDDAAQFFHLRIRRSEPVRWEKFLNRVVLVWYKQNQELWQLVSEMTLKRKWQNAEGMACSALLIRYWKIVPDLSSQLKQVPPSRIFFIARSTTHPSEWAHTKRAANQSHPLALTSSHTYQYDTSVCNWVIQSV